MKRLFCFLRDYIKNNKHCLLLLYWPVHTLWYELARILQAESDVLIVHSPLDESIPFIEWFVFPYVLWFPYIAAVLLWGLHAGRREFLRDMALITAGMFIPMLFCTIVPNGLTLDIRPDLEALGRSNIGTWAVKVIYASDSPPRCIMPSMHCAVSLSLFYALLRSEKLKGRARVKIAGGVLSLLIILATVFIKQHSVLDLFAGLGLSLVTCPLITWAEYLIDKKKAKKAQEATE
ncbi:MAG: phosphatase PAP2 family protein [Clostridia bacterium]|nr:phosphatase PAP2 family protein [Clostridia bacterium]